jgi:hypothetical protein
MIVWGVMWSGTLHIWGARGAKEEAPALATVRFWMVWLAMVCFPALASRAGMGDGWRDSITGGRVLGPLQLIGRDSLADLNKRSLSAPLRAGRGDCVLSQRRKQATDADGLHVSAWV